MDEETKAAISQALTGVPLGPMSEAHRAALSAAKMGVPMGEAHRQAI